MKRREFIVLTSVGAASATVLTSCGHPEQKLIPAFIPDDDYIPGLDYWKTSTCGLCSAGCGIVVRTREHKANKIEGNAQHPVNSGALCARGQAGLQLLYNPDRINGPMKRTGERGSGEFAPITWDEAIKSLATRVGETKQQPDSLVFLTGQPHGVTGFAAEALATACGSKSLVAAGFSNEPVTLAGYQKSYGVQGVPFFDIANATYLLSFGARFLETWHSPVMYSLAYGDFRNSRGQIRGTLVQVEPRMSLTAANADEWLPAAPGTEGLLALAIAQVIVRENLSAETPKPAFLSSPLDDYAPEKTTERIDISVERIVRIAREFAKSARPLAIAGGSAADHESIHFLNTLVGNIGKPGGVMIEGASRFDPFAGLRTNAPEWSTNLEAAIAAGKARALLIHRANPAYEKPSVVEALKTVPFIASFSVLMDETTRLADLVIPDHTYLESWDLTAAGAKAARVATITAPVVTPEFDARQTADVIIATLREVGGGAETSLPFESSQEIVRKAAGALRTQGGSVTAENDDDFWTALAERGVWSSDQGAKQNGSAKPGAPAAAKAKKEQPLAVPVTPATQPEPETAGDYPLTLLAFESASLGFGEHANLPALQELPDPMTSVVWGSWLEVNPRTAADLGIADGDLVQINTPHGEARVPAIVYPAIRPDVVAMPSGQGHTNHGTFSQNRGVNIATLFPQSRGTLPQPGLVRARITRLAEKARLVRFGTNIPEHEGGR